MIAFPGMLVAAAEKVGIPVPKEPKNYEKERSAFPQFYLFCKVQLGASMPRPTSHWDNAQIFADLLPEEYETITMEQLLARGLQMTFR